MLFQVIILTNSVTVTENIHASIIPIVDDSLKSACLLSPELPALSSNILSNMIPICNKSFKTSCLKCRNKVYLEKVCTEHYQHCQIASECIAIHNLSVLFRVFVDRIKTESLWIITQSKMIN